MNTLPLIGLRSAVLAAALASSLAGALGGCTSAPSSGVPMASAAPLASESGVKSPRSTQTTNEISVVVASAQETTLMFSMERS